MDFSLNQIYELDSKCQKVLRSVLKLSRSSSLSCISEENIRKADKEDLSNVILSLVDVTENSVNFLKSAAVSMEQLCSERVINQGKIIKLQNELIQKQETLSSVGTESSSSSEQVMKNNIKSAIKSVVQENERQQEIMLFGVSEDTSDLGETVEDIVQCVSAPAKPQVRDCCRIGVRVPGKVRPVKVTFSSKDDAKFTVQGGKNLKTSEKYGKVFIAPNRTPEERLKRRKLVQLLREKKTKEPGKHHFIYRDTVCSRDQVKKEQDHTNNAHSHSGQLSVSELENLTANFSSRFEMMTERLCSKLDQMGRRC